MSTLAAVPNIFVDGTSSANLIDAVQMNANFAAVLAAYNNIYPSQILPTTAAQATFGATASGVGYTFTANDATATPLTINAVTSQSGNIFNVALTAGGTSALRVSATGNTVLGLLSFLASSGIAPAAGQVEIYNDSAATSGMVLSVPPSSTNGFRFFGGGTAGTLLAQLTSGGALSILGGNVNSAGDLGIARSTITAAMFFGSSATLSGNIDFGTAVSTGFALRNSAGAGFAPVSGGAYTNASDARLKKNVAPISYGLDAIKALKPSSFDWICDDLSDLGFIAQEVQSVMPEIVKSHTMEDGTEILGVTSLGILAATVKATQELAAAFEGYAAAHP